MTQKFHDLVAGARSYRRFDQSKKMTMQELEELAELGRITPCGGNRQYIRFALCADEKMNAEIYKNLAWAGYLSDWDGPVEGERPTGYILILRDLSIQKNQTVDEGIVAQTIFLGSKRYGLRRLHVNEYQAHRAYGNLWIRSREVCNFNGNRTRRSS